ncbi:glycoside hydrolase superfamily [Cladochytrium replicatum]|nr:glycoside hydrolase superfamily [Cladochytrium replicatum]
MVGILSKITANAVVAGLLLTNQLVASSPIDVEREHRLSERATAVNIVVDPSYQQPPFQGWGTSLAWMSVVTGGYPDEIRNKLVDMLFGEDGLNLNIARYNIGGGNAPNVKDYMMVTSAGHAVPGWWKSPNATFGPNDKDWWDPNNPNNWNWDADPNQRWWIDQIKSKVTAWEVFSNSPPWFQTVSGYVSGGFDANAEQIRSEKVADFATYLVRVTEKLEEAHGIKIDTIEPINEPNTNYWATTLTNGVPSAKQEGCHVGPAMQSNVVVALKNRLASSSTSALVSAPDETNPGIFVTDYYGWSSAGMAAVDQLNVHTYGTDNRPGPRDIAKSAGKPLWMSEVEGTWGSSFTSMDSGLGFAQHIVDDIRLLEPTAWVLWQPIESGSGTLTGDAKQWGEIHIPFNCTSSSTIATCPILTNTKYNTVRQFTHYIRPNDRFVRLAGNTNTVAAIKADGSGAVLVHVNAGTDARDLTLDFSGFSDVSNAATVTPVVSTETGALVKGAAVAVANKKAVVTVPASSVSTLIVDGVSGVLESSAIIQASKSYRLQGVQSSKYLQPSSDGASLVIASLNSSSLNQRWTFRRLSTGTYSSRDRFVIVNVGTGKRLAVSSTGTPLFETDSTTTSSVPVTAQWLLSTSGDGAFTVVSAAVRAILDVGNQSTAENAQVSTYRPNSGTNQQWKVTAV